MGADCARYRLPLFTADLLIHAALRAELVRCLVIVTGSSFLGAMLGDAVVAVLLAVTGLLIQHVYYALRLLRWADQPRQHDLPDGQGIWRAIYKAALTRDQQARLRKDRLGSMLSEFRASTAALPDAAVVLDAQSRITWLNEAARNLMGLSPVRDVGQRIGNLIRHPDFLRYYDSPQTAEDGVELPSPINEGQILWLRVIPYGLDQKLMIARDVSVFKRLERARRDFVANASHELRTPLTVVRGYLDMLGEDLAQDEVVKVWAKPVEEMRRQAARMEHIIADLLKLADLEAATEQPRHVAVAMPALIAGALEEAEVLSAGRHVFERQLDEDLLLQGNAAQLHSVVANLLSNAVRYSPDGALIHLSWGLEQGSPVLSVRDKGIGIPAREIPRLTERFYRSDAARSRETGGTGLGLAIVKHALERHDADLVITSTPGKGSCFRCVFSSSRGLSSKRDQTVIKA